MWDRIFPVVEWLKICKWSSSLRRVWTMRFPKVKCSLLAAAILDKVFLTKFVNYVGWWTASYTASTADPDFLADLYPLYSILLSLSFSVFMVPLPCTALHFIMYPWHCVKGVGKRLAEGYAVMEMGNLCFCWVRKAYSQPVFAHKAWNTWSALKYYKYCILVLPFYAVNPLAVTKGPVKKA